MYIYIYIYIYVFFYRPPTSASSLEFCKQVRPHTGPQRDFVNDSEMDKPTVGNTDPTAGNPVGAAGVKTRSWTGPPRGERAPRVGIKLTVFGERAYGKVV
jgi:hypothetical protein